MKLTPRLALAARLCTPADGGSPGTLIDVGCDHGYLSIWLVGSGAFAGAIASDLRAGPLARAAENIRAAGLECAIETRLASGLEGLGPERGSTIAICGMGGELIAAILADAPWALTGQHTLVLQPQSKSEALRAFLHSRGCAIDTEGLAPEGQRLYSVLRARGGGRAEAMAREPGHWLFSRAMMGDPLFPRYLEGLVARQRRAIAGRRQGGLDCTEAEALLGQLIQAQG